MRFLGQAADNSAKLRSIALTPKLPSTGDALSQFGTFNKCTHAGFKITSFTHLQDFAHQIGWSFLQVGVSDQRGGLDIHITNLLISFCLLCSLPSFVNREEKHSQVSHDGFRNFPWFVDLLVHGSSILPQSSVARLFCQVRGIVKQCYFCFAGVVTILVTLQCGYGLHYIPEDQGLQEVPDIPAAATHVYLTYQHISHIEPQTFSHLTQCQDLKLAHNKLTEVRSDMWEGLNSLEYLWLQGNRISRLSAGSFSTLPSLALLDLDHNNLAAVGRDIFIDVESLEILKLSGNPISSIESGSFSGLPNVHYLGLGYAELSEVRVDMFEGLTSLGTLGINNNRLSNVDRGTFVSTPNLSRLWLSGNSISVVRNDMWEGISLRYLHLGHNNIQSINGEMWDNIKSLRLLELNSNPLKYISPQMWEGLEELRELRLENISIAFIPPNTFANLPNLSRVKLEANRLQTLSANVFGSDVPAKFQFTLGNNPLQCDSRLCWMKEAEDQGWLKVLDARCANLDGEPFSNFECAK